MNDEHNLPKKVKEYLNRKLTHCNQKLIKLKCKRKRIKILYVMTVLYSIVILAATVSLTNVDSIPIIIITLLSESSDILAGV